MQRSPRLDLFTIIVAYIGFIGIGLAGTTSLLGVAWSRMQAEFGVRLDAVAFVLTAGVIGYLASSFFSGALAFRFGIGRMLVLGGILITTGLLVSLLASAFWLLAAVTLISGFGSGMIDAGLNGYVAQHHGARAMNWLHASYGVGATLGPLMMTLVFQAGLSWRIGYGIVAGFIIFTTVLFFVMVSSWQGVITQGDHSTPVQRPSMRTTLSLPVVWVGIAMFFLYAGLEATPAQWVYTLFTQGRGIAEDAAGLWVSIYWASFTIGRIFFGAIITRLNTLTLLRACMVGVLIGAILLWWNPAAWVGFAGLTFLGFMEAPLFPVLVSNTPKRVGVLNAGNAIGFQVSGAGVGIAALPALAGVLATNVSIQVIPPFIVVVAVIVIVLHELSVMQGARIDQRAAAPVGD